MAATTGEPRTATPITVAGLLPLIEPFGPTVEDGALVFDRDPPTELRPHLRVLHTGLRAVLTGRRWFGCGSAAPCPKPLDPAAPIPNGITLLTVEGDHRWDRIHPAARIDRPELFAPPVAKPRKRVRRRRPQVGEV